MNNNTDNIIDGEDYYSHIEHLQRKEQPAQSSTVPLWKRLNGERVQGNLTYNNHWRNGISLRRGDEKVCEFYGPFDEDAITAEYTALAVNNFANIVEALQSILNTPICNFQNCDNYFFEKLKTAKSAIKAIS